MATFTDSVCTAVRAAEKLVRFYGARSDEMTEADKTHVCSMAEWDALGDALGRAIAASTALFVVSERFPRHCEGLALASRVWEGIRRVWELPMSGAFQKAVKYLHDEAPRFDANLLIAGIRDEATTPRADQTTQWERKCKVLFLAANPEGTNLLMLDEESREIEHKIRAADYRDSLELITKWAVRPDDLLQYLNEFRPQVVHFSGHGSKTEEILLLDANRAPKPVSKSALKQLFSTLKDNIRVVVLNACYSRPQAEAIVEVIDCAIGMKLGIGDDAAIAFAASFYRAIGFGRSVYEAFEQGRTALMLAGIPEQDTPELLTRPGVDPKTIFLVMP